jgi:molybdopterin-guanine dinucleotide biosynthesis protein A
LAAESSAGRAVHCEAAASRPVARAAGHIDGISGIVLAGGKSSRMGRRKATLEIDGMTIIERVVEVLRSVFAHNLIVVNETGLHAELGPPVVVDDNPGGGSLIGLYTGLSHAPTEYALCVACDMPFLSETLIRYLAGLRGDHDVILPVTEHGPEPLHAIYRKSCLARMKSNISAGQLAIHKLFGQLNVKEVSAAEVRRHDTSMRSLANCNTPEEFARLGGRVHA